MYAGTHTPKLSGWIGQFAIQQARIQESLSGILQMTFIPKSKEES